VTTADSVVRVHNFESTVRKYLDSKVCTHADFNVLTGQVPRIMLVLDPIKVIIDDLADGYTEELTVSFDPKKPTGPSRKMTFSKTVYIDRSDFREVDSPDFFRLAPGKAVGLLSAPFPIKATSFEKEDGKVTVIHATKAEGKPKAWIHWVGAGAISVVARQYSALFNSENPNELDWQSGGYADHLNPNSEVSWPNAMVEPGLLDLQASTETKESDGVVRFQAVRTAYFAVDPEKVEGKIVLNQIVTLKEDAGKTK
jgi:glutaminyl-tRNA synthetase